MICNLTAAIFGLAVRSGPGLSECDHTCPSHNQRTKCFVQNILFKIFGSFDCFVTKYIVRLIVSFHNICSFDCFVTKYFVRLIVSFRLLAQVEASEAIAFVSHSEGDWFVFFHTLLEACSAVGDFEREHRASKQH